MANCTTIYTSSISIIAYLTPLQKNLIVAMQVTLMPFTIFLNLILIISLIKTKQVNKKSNYLILMLNTSDLMQGAISLPLDVIIIKYYPVERNCAIEIIHQIVDGLFVYLSTSTTLLIAIDRYVKIDPNLRNMNNPIRRVFSTTKIWIPIGLTIGWVVLSLITVLMFAKFLPKYVSIVGLFFLNLHVFTTLMIFLMYFRFYFKIWKFTKHSTVHAETSVVSGDRSRPAYINQLGVTVFMILTTLLICCLPYSVVVTYLTVVKEMHILVLTQSQILVTVFTVAIFYLNTTLNAAIFLLRNKEIKTLVYKNLCSKICPVCRCFDKRNIRVIKEQNSSRNVRQTHVRKWDVTKSTVQNERLKMDKDKL